MADINDRNVNTAFTGLLTTVAIFGGVGAICLIGFETFRQFRRLPNVHFTRFWRNPNRDVGGGIDGQEEDEESKGAAGGFLPKWNNGRWGLGTRNNKQGGKGKLTCEDWEMGHLYLARMFHATTPSPPLARWPLGWTWQALRFDDWFYATHTGMDTVVYVRYLRALVYFMALHTFTTAPLLLGINLKFSKGASYDDMSAASISFLVTIPDANCADVNSADCHRTPNNEGRALLWIHLCMMYWISITWFIGLWWIGKGSLRIRSRLIEETRKKRKERKRKEKEEQDRHYDENEETNGDSELDINAEMTNAHGLGGKETLLVTPEDDDEGWRQRTLMVLNLPTTMRDEASIRRYFEEFLRPDDDGSILDMDINSSQNGLQQQEGDSNSISNLSITPSNREGKSHSRRSQNLSEDSNLSAIGESTGMMTAHGAHEGTSTNLDRQKSLVRSDRGLLRPDSPQDEEDPNSTSNANVEPVGPEPDTNPDRHLRSPVQTVVLVRKMNELSAMLTRRQEVLAQLEAAHIKLAKNVMAAVGKRTSKMRSKKRDEGKGGMGGVGGGELNGKALKAEAKLSNQFKGSDDTKNTAETEESSNNQDVEKEAVEKSRKQLEEEALEDLTRRLARFSPNNKGRHCREAQMRGDEVEDEMNVMAETVWESLATVPRELLDPYQPATRLSALFRGQTVPTVDYLLTKLNLLTALVTEMRARPPSSYEPTSTAFVTFRDPRQARMVWRELKSQIVVRVRLAPEVKDLDWERLMRTSFTGDLARGLGVNAFFWGLTIFWIIPIQLLTSVLFSVKNLKLVFPPVESFFQANPGVEAFVSVTLPTVLVSLITMAVPEIIFQISKRAQGFVTFSALYDQCLCRYWKFIICNVVIFFCIGVTTIETILQQVVISGDLLLTIAFSFPAAAPFYVSYLILGISLHSGFELFGFMVPLIQHLGARKAFTPRARALKTLPRNFNRYYWLPFHTLIATIVFIFAILNPLVIPFALVYIFVAMIVFKKNFAYVYFRRFNEKDGVVYFTRLLRFSLDGLLIGQIVIVVFFAVTNQRAVYIGMSALLTPFTVAFKLFGTRLWASQSRALDDDEANALCGISVNYAPANGTDDQTPGSHFSTGSRSDGSPLDARARGRYPTVLPAPSTGSAFYRVWHRVHDSFNANGHDKSSYVATAHARGQQLANPVQFGAKSLASAPMGVVKETAGNVSHFKNAITLTFGRNKNYEKKEQPEEVAAREVEEAVVASQDLPMMAAAGDAEFKEEKEIKKQASKEDVSNLRAKSQRRRSSRRGSSRSESRPFLSGADAVLMNAPVEHDAGDMSFNYGDEAGYEARMARTPSGTPRRPSRRGSAYQSPPRLGTTESGYLSDEKGRRLSEFGHLVPAHESEELKADAAEDAANQESALEDEEEEDEDAHRDLVCPHANVRWDDTPSNSARYNNPFYNTELDPFLWLPRDPSGIVDLYDTIEWHGAALVSSQGGQGYVGEWDEEDEEESEFAEKGQFDDGSDDDGGLDAIHGDEQILLTGSLARHLEEVEDVEDVPDPAASLPRAVLADYKKAIRRGSQMDDSQEDSSTFAGNNTLTRHESVLSHSSFRSPTLSARMRVDGDGDRPPSPIDLRSSPTNALRPVSSNDRDQDKLRRKSTKRKDTAGSIPAFDLSSPTADQSHSAPIAEASSSPVSPTPASAPPAPALHFDEAKVAGHDHKASTQGPSRPSNLLPPSTEQRVFSSPAAGVSFQTPTQGLERNTAGGSSHFRYGTGASGMSGASLRSGVTSLGRNRTISMKKALQAEVMEEERRLLLKEKLGTVKRKTALLKGTTQKIENEQSEALQRGDTIMSRHERALQRRREARSEVGSSYDPTEQSPTHARVVSDSQTPRGSRFLLRDMSFSRTPKNGNNPHGHGNVDGANLQMQELNAAGLANSARSKTAMTSSSSKDQMTTPTPANDVGSSKRPTNLVLGQSNYQYTDFGLQASPTSYKTGSAPATARKDAGDSSSQAHPSSSPRPNTASSEKKK